MTTLRYDEQRLRTKLDSLGRAHRATFAAACAERVLPGYARYSSAGVDLLRAALTCVWDDLMGHQASDSELRLLTKRCLDLMPPEQAEPIDEQPLAEDAVAAVLYALRVRMEGDSELAAWSARRAYEAVGHYVTFVDGEDDISAGIGDVTGHPLIQGELIRQERDLDELLGATKEAAIGVIARIRDRARSDSEHFFGP